MTNDAAAAAPGLTSARAAELLAQVGKNELKDEGAAPARLRIFLAQFRGALVWLLLGAVAVSAFVGEMGDAIAIAVIVVLNALLGFSQELRAERAVAALKRLGAPHARVVRDGHLVSCAAADVVPGDLLVVEAGDIAAADARLVEANRLSADEAVLTGESVPVDKRASDSLSAGTSIATGTGRAIVTATGMSTSLGSIASMLAANAATDQRTPLEARLDKVGRTLLFLCLGIVAVVAAAGLAHQTPPLTVLMTSVSLAVAAVPEGLAAIVTVALAISVQRMVAHNAIVRRLAAVETLGCATVICTDKTGTLTTGQMRVRDVWALDRTRALTCASACCDADYDPRASTAAPIGDPTELAILVAAAEAGVTRAAIESAEPRLASQPFDAERKRMSVFRRASSASSTRTLYVKGATEALLPLCTSGPRADAAHANEEMAARGLRVLAIAIGTTADERDLELVGLIGIADPPRDGVIDAVARARAAGVKTIMITGDHQMTALAIARELGILRPGDDASEVVHARATPADKLAIVRALKARGEVVAMTGDGVNDAPALQEAHIGVAMGKGGTDVARAAADMILVDDDYTSIVSAVAEGRGVYDNIQKALVYLLAGNAGELGLMLLASLVGLPLPLTPLQILWMNLVTDGLPALALVFDRPGADVLQRKPRALGENILGRRQWLQIAGFGLASTMVTTTAFLWGLRDDDLVGARSLAFSTVVLVQVFLAVAMRSSTEVFFRTGVFSNLLLLGTVAVTASAQLLLLYVPASQRLFDVAPATPAALMIAVALALTPVTLIELAKLLRAQALRRNERKRSTNGAR